QLISDFVDTYLRLSAQEEQQVQGLTLTTLEQLSEALLDFIGPEDLKRWLSGQETSQI
ncbi:MAG: DUF4351 domain-containing protein, partial [Gemmatimonadaceae bacterium]|nr:DUF4351 domain-containing protein [Gloeobacterales cyanobacterium ES-bin-141]